MYMNTKQKKVVVIGGANGTGLNIQGLKTYKDIELMAVVSMSDSGRSSGKIRQELGALPPADILRVLIAASSYDESLLTEIFYTKRFTHPPKLEQLNIGSALIALASTYTNNLLSVIQNLEQIFDCKAKVLPVTISMTDLHVSLSNGTDIHSEGNIDCPQQPIPDDVVITRSWLDPTGKIDDPAREALEQADVIITGPGDLYTSNIAPLLTEGCFEAIKKSSAKLVYVAGNKYTIGGEPAPKTLSERVAALQMYLPRRVDLVLYDTHVLQGAEIEMYKERDWGLIDFDTESLDATLLIGADIERDGGGIDPKKLGMELHQYIQTIK